MQLVWVLVEPRRPENVGAAARALNTQGFSRLRLVRPCDHLSDPARWLAHGSHALLESAEVFDSVEDAIADADLVVGTTAKLRHGFSPLYTPDALQAALAGKDGTAGRTAVLFGPEDTGLENDILDRCHLLSGVPLAQPFPSLNLAQAVMVYAHALSGLRASARAEVPMAAEAGQWAALAGRTGALLQSLEAEPALARWVQERLPLLTGRDVRMMHSLLSRLERRLAVTGAGDEG